MKQPYNWDYTIRVKTKEGTFEYEKETLDNLDLLLEQHKDYEELRATKNTLHCDKCKIELNEVFIQQYGNRTYRLCKSCNDYFMRLQDRVKKLERVRNGTTKSKQSN